VPGQTDKGRKSSGFGGPDGQKKEANRQVSGAVCRLDKCKFNGRHRRGKRNIAAASAHTAWHPSRFNLINLNQLKLD
jgi:hypothetical protein